jgi:O-antigen/teichoic acid export membrane protein
MAQTEASSVVVMTPRSRSVMYSIALGSSAVYAGAIAAMALGFVSRALVARILTPAQLGILVTAQTVQAMTQAVGQFGLVDAVVRFVGRFARTEAGKAKGVVIRSLGIAATSTALLGIALGSLALILVHSFPKDRTLLDVIAVLAFAVPCATAGELLGAGFQGLGRFWVKVVFIDWGRALCLIAGALLLLALGRDSLLGVTGIYAAGLAISAGCTITWFLRDKYWKVTPAPVDTRSLLGYGVPLLLSAIVNWPGSYFLTLLLAGKVSVQAVAYYSLASTVANLVYMPASAIETAATLAWAGRIAEGSLPELRAEYQFTTRWCLLLGLVLLSVLVLRPTEIVRIIYGPQYTDAAPILRISAAIVTFNVATGPTEGLLRAFGHTREIFGGRLMGGVASLLCAIVLVPRLGIYGALIALAASTVAGVSYFSLALFRSERIHPFTWPYAKTLAAAAASMAVVFKVVPSAGNDFLRVLSVAAAFTVVFAMSLFFAGAFTEKDKRMALRFRRWLERGEMWPSHI